MVGKGLSNAARARGGDPIPGPLDRIQEQSDSSYYREIKARTNELDAPIRVAVIDSGVQKKGKVLDCPSRR